MYLKSRVKLPDVHGKLTRLRRGDITYIKYEYDRYYDPEKKYTYPQRATIGKVCPDDDTMMIPNEAFLKYFPDAVLSGMEDRTERSSCLRVGTYAVMHKIVLDYSLDKLLGQFFSERDMALLLDLASYSIVEESNVAQHYPDYAYNHPSGSLEPSIEDIAITNRMQQRCMLTGVPVVDHIIIGQNDFYYTRFRRHE